MSFAQVRIHLLEMVNCVFKRAVNGGDTFSDATADDIMLASVDGAATRAWLMGFTSSANTTGHSVMRVDGNTGVTVAGAVTASTGIYGPGFSNAAGAVYSSNLSNTGPASFSGPVTMPNGVFGAGFSNAGGAVYSSNLSNTGPASFSGPVTAPNGLYGAGFSNVNGVVYASGIAYQLPSVTSVPRTQSSKLSDRMSVRDFGAVGDGVTDDTLHIQNAINALAGQGGGVLELPQGIFIVTTTLTVLGNVSIIGCGNDTTNLDSQSPNSFATSVLKWGGTTVTSSPVLQQNGNQAGGFRWSDFAVDGANFSGVGIALDRARRCVFSNIAISRTAYCGLFIKPNASAPNDNCMFNVFQNIHIRSNSTAMNIDSYTASANVCHNSFTNIALDHQNYALTMANCDNNSFRMIWSFRRGGSTGYDILLNSSLCRANYFHHSQGVILAVNGSYNAVWGYDRENGQGPPTVDATSRLFCQEHGSGAALTRDVLPHAGLSASVAGDWTPAFKNGQVDYNANILLSQTVVGGQLSASFSTNSGTGRKIQLHCTTDSSTPGLCQSFGKNALGFFDAQPVSRPMVTGSKSNGSALTSLMNALSALGLVTDTTTA